MIFLLCFFFLFRVVFNSFFTIPVDNENVALRLTLAIPTGVPITVANYAIEILPLISDKTIKDLNRNNHKKQYIYYVFYSLIPFL